MRTHHDPIDHVKALLIELGYADEEALKEIDRDVRAIVMASAEFAQSSPEPDPGELMTDILVEA